MTKTEIIRSITLWVSTSHSRCYATSRQPTFDSTGTAIYAAWSRRASMR